MEYGDHGHHILADVVEHAVLADTNRLRRVRRATVRFEVCDDAPFYFDPADQDSFTRELLRAVSDDQARTDAIAVENISSIITAR